MGYRSNVALSISDEGLEYFFDTAEEYMKKNKYDKRDKRVFHELFDVYAKEKAHKGGGMIYMWQDIKWYEFTTCPEIWCVMNVLEQIKIEGKYAYIFVRIGEDYDDVVYDESYGDGTNYAPYIEIERKIIF